MLGKSSKEKSECFISENVDELDKSYVRLKVCQNLPIEYEHAGKKYCLLHYPSLDKIEAFEKEFEKRLTAEDYDFKGVYFPSLISLFSKKFEKSINFHSATFTKGIRVSSTTFSDHVDFIGAIFIGDTYFYEVTFSQYVSFHAATFEEHSDISFSKIRFEKEVDLDYAIFRGYVTFDGERENQMFGKNSLINLQNARLENPERISFHSVRLQPNWFVNTDCRKFVFTACRWKRANGENIDTKSELENLLSPDYPHPHKLLTKTCWQLADNHEEMKSFPKASIFRQMANESKRREDYKGWKIWSLHWWYWLSSYYGERPLQALLILLGIIGAFVFYYHWSFFSICPKDVADSTKCVVRHMDWLESLHQSLITAALQNVEYRKTLLPLQDLAILLEKVLAPLQAALLALAIRRKFMR